MLVCQFRHSPGRRRLRERQVYHAPAPAPATRATGALSEGPSAQFPAGAHPSGCESGSGPARQPGSDAGADAGRVASLRWSSLRRILLAYPCRAWCGDRPGCSSPATAALPGPIPPLPWSTGSRVRAGSGCGRDSPEANRRCKWMRSSPLTTTIARVSVPTTGPRSPQTHQSRVVMQAAWSGVRYPGRRNDSARPSLAHGAEDGALTWRSSRAVSTGAGTAQSASRMAASGAAETYPWRFLE